MKKFALLSAVAMGLAFTACDDNEIIDIPVNPQPAIFEVSNLKIDNTATATLDLEALNNEAKSAELATVSIAGFPEDYDLNIVMQISADESFSRVSDVPVLVEDGKLIVNPDDLQGVYYANISKGPKERTIYARYAAYAVKDNASVRLGNPEYYWGPFAISVLPYPSSLVIEENYYLLGTINDWSVANAIQMAHSDMNQYDDPVFTIKVDISNEQASSGWWWKIVPESTKATGNWVDGDNASYGTQENGSEEMSGMLVARTAKEDCGAGCIKQPGSWLLTINLEEGTYAFTSAIDYLYTPGNSNGWSQPSSQRLFTSDYANYTGFAYLDGDFKFTSKDNWDGINYGNAGTEGALSTDGGAGNLSAPAKGLYWCNVNIASLTYSLTPVTAVGIIGDATEKGWDGDIALTPSANYLVWKGTFKFAGSGEWKFRMNNAWDINLGGSMNDLVPGGANLATPGAGTYEVTLDLTTLPYTASVVKK